MAYNNGLLNFGDSYVEVGYDNEDYSVDKAQIVEKDGTVHELGGGGSSDFSTASVTIDNTTRTSINCAVPVISEELQGVCKALRRITGEDYMTISVPLYKGKALLMFQDGTISVTGAIDGSLGGGAFVVTGDGSITIS